MGAPAAIEMIVWNVALTTLVFGMGFFIKNKFAELERIGILLNRTREEVARDHITRAEVKSDLEKIMERFDTGFQRLEAKIDELSRKG
jgi:hypothetical protein